MEKSNKYIVNNEYSNRRLHNCLEMPRRLCI